MSIEKMNIEGAWVFKPVRHLDERGHFEELFRQREIEACLGREFVVKQVNKSFSKRGTFRGIHYTTSEAGQDKYVSCVNGSILDIVVDLRKNSPTFGEWETMEISAENGHCVLVQKGLGHGFLSLEDRSVVSYLCNNYYDPNIELSLNAASPLINLPIATWKLQLGDLKLSDKDSSASMDIEF